MPQLKSLLTTKMTRSQSDVVSSCFKLFQMNVCALCSLRFSGVFSFRQCEKVPIL